MTTAPGPGISGNRGSVLTASKNPGADARVAASPTIVITGVIVMFLLGGAVLVETVFNFSGLGQYAVQSIITADYAPIQGFVSFAAIFTMLVYLAVDLIQFAMDLRVKVGGRGAQ